MMVQALAPPLAALQPLHTFAHPGRILRSHLVAPAVQILVQELCPAYLHNSCLIVAVTSDAAAAAGPAAAEDMLAATLTVLRAAQVETVAAAMAFLVRGPVGSWALML